MVTKRQTKLQANAEAMTLLWKIYLFFRPGLKRKMQQSAIAHVENALADLEGRPAPHPELRIAERKAKEGGA